MKRLLQTVIGCFSLFSASAQTAFTPGNLVVLQTSGTASKASSQATLKEYSTTGAAGMSVAIPITGPTPFQTAGIFGGSEGFLTTSTDGKYLVLGGYATAATISDITASTASTAPRAVGLVYPSGFYLQFDTSTTFFSANDMRGAVSDGTNFWAAGASNNSIDGIDYFGPGAHVALAVSSSPPKGYGIRIFNGQIYFSTQKAGPTNTSSQLGIFALGTGLPVNGTPAVTQVVNTGSVVPEDFSFNATADICYIAINLNTAAGGIQKWTRSGTIWTLAYTLGTGITNTGAYGLAVDYSGTYPVIYATTFDAAGNRVIKITDNGSTAAATTLVAAVANVFYKGITFAPSISGTPVVNLSVSKDTASETAVSVITVTANTSFPVGTAQTVTVGVSGTGITAGDYSLSGTTITIPAGATSGSVTFTVVDDILGEGIEKAILTISSPSAGIAAGLHMTQSVTIYDNDGNNHPTIAMQAGTTDYIDNGLPAASPFKLSGVISDPTDPAKTLGINFLAKDLETVSTSLTAWVISSNTAVVPNANITITGSDSVRNIKITPAAVGYSNITLKVSDGIDTTSYIINYAASIASVTPVNTFWHTGMSDASDGVPIDDNFFISGDDELDVLNVYSRTSSGLPVKSYDYTTTLGLSDPTKPEVDLEAAAVSPANSHRVYWLGSMSNAKSPFENRPNRDRLFATDYTGTGAATTFTPAGYTALRSSIVAWGDANGYNFSASAAAGVDSKTSSGFAAEGMVFGPDNTTLYIGLRAPLAPTATRTNAVIVPVLNFESWFNNGAPAGAPTYGSPIELNMGGRGIRDIIRLSNGTYVIIAGNPAGSPLTSAIYKWTGKAGDKPIPVSCTATNTLNLEGVMQVNTGGALSLTTLQVITDQGDDVFYNDGTAAKDFGDLIYRKFRSDVLTPVDLTYPEINLQGNAVNISDSDMTPSTADNTDFGNVHFHMAANQDFVIQNNGTTPLIISAITFTGTDAADFTLLSAPSFPITIAAGNTRTISVEFQPHAIVSCSAQMNIINNDYDESTYEVALHGNGICNILPSRTLTGGGTICAGGAGFAVSLDHADTGINYQLYNGASAVGTAIAGNNAVLSFGTQTVAGTYSVIATDTATTCSQAMDGTAVIVINPLPAVFTVGGGGAYCAGGTGMGISLANSSEGISYSVFNGTTLLDTVTGTGSALNFGPQTAAGDYTIIAADTLTTCTDTMTGTAHIVINPLLTPSVSLSSIPGDTVCAGTVVAYTPAVINGGTTPSFQWKVNGTNVATTGTYTFTPANGDRLIVTLTSSEVCASPTTAKDTIAMRVLINAIPAVAISVMASDTICRGASASFTPAPFYGGSSAAYTWYVNGLNVSTSPVYTYTPANDDIVSAEMQSSYRCPATTTPAHSNVIRMTLTEPLIPTLTLTAHPGWNTAAGHADTLIAIVSNVAAPVYQWYKGSTAIAGATTPMLISSTFADNDSITCVVTNTDACALSAFNSVILHPGTTGIAAMGSIANIMVLPNPSNGTFTIKGNTGISGTTTVGLQISNMLGQQVYSKHATTTDGAINEQVSLGETISNGMYILNITSGTESKAFHIMIAK